MLRKLSFLSYNMFFFLVFNLQPGLLATDLDDGDAEERGSFDASQVWKSIFKGQEGEIEDYLDSARVSEEVKLLKIGGEHGPWKVKDLANSVHKVLEQIQSSSSSAQEDFILLLGKTGAGKSTLTNILMGYEMRYGKDEDTNQWSFQLVQEGATISSEFRSCTKLPYLYYSTEKRLKVCDCPGLYDTEGMQARLKSALLTEACATKLSPLKLVVVIEESEIDGRGVEFRRISSALMKLINYSRNPQILYIINDKKDEGTTLRQLNRRLENFISSTINMIRQEFPLSHRKVNLSRF